MGGTFTTFTDKKAMFEWIKRREGENAAKLIEGHKAWLEEHKAWLEQERNIKPAMVRWEGKPITATEVIKRQEAIKVWLDAGGKAEIEAMARWDISRDANYQEPEIKVDWDGNTYQEMHNGPKRQEPEKPAPAIITTVEGVKSVLTKLTPPQQQEIYEFMHGALNCRMRG